MNDLAFLKVSRAIMLYLIQNGADSDGDGNYISYSEKGKQISFEYGCPTLTTVSFTVKPVDEKTVKILSCDLRDDYEDPDDEEDDGCTDPFKGIKKGVEVKLTKLIKALTTANENDYFM